MQRLVRPLGACFSLSGPQKGTLKKMENPLAVELAYYEEHRQELLEHHEGKFVLIKGGELVDAFDTAEAAYAEGVKRFGNAPMLIRQVLPKESVDWAPALTLGVLRASPKPVLPTLF